MLRSEAKIDHTNLFEVRTNNEVNSKVVSCVIVLVGVTKLQNDLPVCDKI